MLLEFYTYTPSLDSSTQTRTRPFCHCFFNPYYIHEISIFTIGSTSNYNHITACILQCALRKFVLGCNWRTIHSHTCCCCCCCCCLYPAERWVSCRGWQHFLCTLCDCTQPTRHSNTSCSYCLDWRHHGCFDYILQHEAA